MTKNKARPISRNDISKDDLVQDFRWRRKRLDREAVATDVAGVHILLALSDGDLHGYGIMQEVAEHTAGQIHLGPGTLYGAIKRLLNSGLIVETDQRPDVELDDERRRYYRLTDFGRKVLKAEAQRPDRRARHRCRRHFYDKHDHMPPVPVLPLC